MKSVMIRLLTLLTAAAVLTAACDSSPRTQVSTTAGPNSRVEAQPFNGESYRTKDGRSAITLISADELEYRVPDGTTLLCKYSSQKDTLRVIVTALGTQQVLYFRRVPTGLVSNDGTLYLSPSALAEVGFYLVLNVQTDDALYTSVVATLDRVRVGLEEAGATGFTANARGATQIQVDGLSPTQDALFRRTAALLAPTFNIEGGIGSAFTLTLKTDVVVRARKEAVSLAQQIIERRLNGLGVANPVVTQHGGTGSQLRVSLPIDSDVDRTKQVIQSTAALTLKIIEGGPTSTREALLQPTNGAVPTGFEVLSRVDNTYYLVKKLPVVTNQEILDVQPALDDTTRRAVRVTLNSDGARKVSQATGGQVGRQLAIEIDGRIVSVLKVTDRPFDASGFAVVSTEMARQDLSLVLRSGALPASLTFLEQGAVR